MVLCYVCVDSLLLINLQQTIFSFSPLPLTHAQRRQDFLRRKIQRAKQKSERLNLPIRFFFIFFVVFPSFSFPCSHLFIFIYFFFVRYCSSSSASFLSLFETRNHFHLRSIRQPPQKNSGYMKKEQQMPFNSLPNNHFISLLKTHYTN